MIVQNHQVCKLSTLAFPRGLRAPTEMIVRNHQVCKLSTLAFPIGLGTCSVSKVLHALLRLISVTVFSFTCPLLLSAQLLIITGSAFLPPDSPLLVPMPFMSLAPVHGVTSPSSPTETLSGLLQI